MKTTLSTISPISVKRARLAYSLALIINLCGWGLFFAFSTRYITVELGGGIKSMYLFTGANWLFTLLAIFSNPIALLLGEKKAVLLGLLITPLLIISVFPRDPFIVALVLSATSFPWAITWPIILKTVFSRTTRSLGREYGIFTMGSGVGFLIGSLLTGPLYAVGSVWLVYTIIAVFITISYIIYYEYYTPSIEEQFHNLNIGLFKLLKYVLLALCLVVFTRELLYTYAPVKINNELKALTPGYSEWFYYLLYGLIYSGGAIISPLARILAGKLVDKYGSTKTLIPAIISYIILYWSFTKTTGLIPLILWQIPIYPFFDTAINAHIAELLPRSLHIKGFALSTTFTAIGGSLVTLLLLVGIVDVDLAGVVVTSASLISLLLLFYEERRLRHLKFIISKIKTGSVE